MVRYKQRISQNISLHLPLFLLLLCLRVIVAHDDEDAPRDVDFRIFSYRDLLQSQISVFTHSDIRESVQVTLDTPRNQILVGARDCMFRLSIDDLTKLEYAEWLPANMTKLICRFKGKTEETCHNFVRVLLVDNKTKRVLACGTNAYKPSCTWRPVNHLNSLEDPTFVSGVAKCPFDPLYNATAILSSDGDLYTGTAMDITARDPAIYRALGPSKHLRTVPHNSKWLNEPDFVSTYDIKDFVYFFFREAAVEYINCGKRKYSRVARICKTDKGGNLMLEDNWTTFLKARLNCSLPGDYPFYFDEVQSTFYQKEDKLFYTVFTTPSNSIPGSALCVYNLSAIHSSFIGPFKYQETSKSAWQRHANMRHQQKCSLKNEAQKRSNFINQKIMTAQKYQLMDNAIQPVSPIPLKVQMTERWSHIVVDNVQTKHHATFPVIFIGTTDGKLRKMAQLPTSGEMCLIEVISMVPEDSPGPVTSLRLEEKKGALFVTTKNNIVRVPVHRCGRFKSRKMCLSSMDPYCGWNSFSKACTISPEGNPNVHFWHQRIVSCPKLTHPVDGKWSQWSDWSKCQHLSGSGDMCMCRMRSCNRPKPYKGGCRCEGHTIEVTNCTVHGSWTAWSDWTTCSSSCGPAVKSRQRWCTNPPPRHGGRACVGATGDEQSCSDSPLCTEPPMNDSPLNSSWSKWTEWGDCTAKCNSGIQSRSRSCDTPRAGPGGRGCLGNQQEWRSCNTQPCPVVRRTSQWTPWVRTNGTLEGGRVEQRYRHICRASVEDPAMVKSAIARTEERFCLPGGAGCHRTGELRRKPHALRALDRLLKKYCRVSRASHERQRKGLCSCRSLGVFVVCEKCPSRQRKLRHNSSKRRRSTKYVQRLKKGGRKRT